MSCFYTDAWITVTYNIAKTAPLKLLPAIIEISHLAYDWGLYCSVIWSTMYSCCFSVQ